MPDKQRLLIKKNLLTNPEFVDISIQIIEEAYKNGLITKKDKFELVAEISG